MTAPQFPTPRSARTRSSSQASRSVCAYHPALRPGARRSTWDSARGHADLWRCDDRRLLPERPLRRDPREGDNRRLLHALQPLHARGHHPHGQRRADYVAHLRALAHLVRRQHLRRAWRDHPQRPLPRSRRTPMPTPRGPTIEDDVMIGGGCTILPGVRIGARSFIAAGAVVSCDIRRAAWWSASLAKSSRCPSTWICPTTGSSPSSRSTSGTR